MPFYGSFDFFRRAVTSVLEQTDGDWRLTILDDVYPDPAPGEWAKSLDDPRVTYLRNETNLRPSRNYNKGVSLAVEDFVQIMGCDDVLLPGYVARVNELLREFPTADIVQPGVEVIDETGADAHPLADRVKAMMRPGRGVRELSGEALATSLLRGNWTYFPSLVWRRTLLAGGFRPDLDVVQDLAMLFQIVADGGTMVVDDEVVFRFRRHSTSVSAVTGYDGSKFLQENTLFAEAAAKSSSLGWRRAARAARGHWTSRLNAMTELPGAIRSHNPQGRRNLARHVVGRGPAASPPAS